MTDEEKAEEYFCEHCENSFEHDNGHCSNCSKWDYFIAGLAEGRKEANEKNFKKAYQKYVNNSLATFDMKKALEDARDQIRIAKENEELKSVCDYNCPVHKLATHNTCLTCPAVRNSPHHDLKNVSDEELQKIIKDAEAEMEM